MPRTRKNHRGIRSILSERIISLILVTQNDEDIVQERLNETKKTLSRLKTNYEILVVDNNSIDQTVEKITSTKRIMRYTRILVLSKTYDPEVALTAGLDNCVGDAAILFNIYTDPVEAIPLLLNRLDRGYDIIIGKNRKEVTKHGFLSRLILTLAEKLSTQGFYYRQNYLMGLDRKVINSITRTRRKSRNFSYISSLIGFKKTTLAYKPIKKYKYKLKRESFFELCLSILDTVISNSFRPIRFLSFAGMMVSILYLIYVAVIVVLAFFFGMKYLLPKGWTTISTAVASMFFLLFSLLALISEYIIRILNETRDEPFYFVSEEINQSTILPKKRMLNIV